MAKKLVNMELHQMAHRLAKLLVTDPYVIYGHMELAGELEIPAHESTRLEINFRNGTSTAFTLVKGILDIWISKNGGDATVETLVDVLRSLHFVDAAERIKAEFEPNAAPRNVQRQSFHGGKYLQIDRINEGTFGEVFRVESNRGPTSGSRYAMKRISMGKFLRNVRGKRMHQVDQYLQRLCMEVKIMQTVEDTTRIVRYWDSFFEGPFSGKYQGCFQGTAPLTEAVQRDSAGKPIVSQDEEQTYLCIVMGLCEMDLDQWMENTPIRSLEQVTDIIKQILEGLCIIHGLGIIHRDIKPNNILLLLDPKLTVKIGDFGVSKDVTETIFLTNDVGCETFRCPEMYAPSPGTDTIKYTTKADIYSLGIIYLLLLHKFETNVHLQYAISGLKIGKSGILDDVEKECKREFPILRQMLEVDPNCRPDAKAAVTGI